MVNVATNGHKPHTYILTEKEYNNLVNPTSTNEGAKTAEGEFDEWLKNWRKNNNTKYAVYASYHIDAIQAYATQQLAEKDKEIANLEMQLLSANNLLKATKSELPTDEEIGEWVCKEFKVDGLDADEDVRTQYGYLPAYFKSFAVWMRSKFPQSELPTHEEIVKEASKISGRATEYNWQHKRFGFIKGAKWMRSKFPQSELPSIKEMMHKIKMDMCNDIMKPQSDGQRYGEGDKFMLQRIRRYFLSKSALPFEKDAYLFIDKLFQTLQSKEKEPKQDLQRYSEARSFFNYLVATEIIGDPFDAESFEEYIYDNYLATLITQESKEQEPKGSKCETCNGKQVRKENGNIIICGDCQ